MDNIIEVYVLEGTHTSKIYRFAGDNTNSTASKETDIPTKTVNQLISVSKKLGEKGASCKAANVIMGETNY